jgi:hypothetical protein
MSTLPSTHERNRLRQSLINLASLLVLTLLVCGLVSLFALWSMERLHAQAATTQINLLKAVNDARTSQVAFKIQVQSWKNLLIRGDVASDYEAALQDFQASERTTEESLKFIAAWAGSVHDSDLATKARDIIAQHAEIGRAYRTAMPTQANVKQLRATADAAVRGIDRPLNRRIDEMAAEIVTKNAEEGQRQRQLEHDRFSTLSRAIWISIGLSLLLVSSLLWRTLRDPALHG